MMNKSIILASSCLLLINCGGDQETEVSIEQLQQVPALNAMSIALTPLKSVNSTDFEQHLRNGVYLNSIQQAGVLETVNLNITPTSSGDQSRYSSTINQEIGVDEGDRIKYDGEFIYIANRQHYQVQALSEETPTSKTSIRILQRDEQGEVSEVSNTVVSANAYSTNNLYLNDRQLSVLSNVYGLSNNGDTDVSDIMNDTLFPIEQRFNLSLLDISDRTSPAVTVSYTMDGAIIDSRRIDDLLYIVSSYSPYMAELPYAVTESDKLDNYKSVFLSNINNLLPQLIDAQGNSKNLVEPDNCYLPAEVTDKDGFNGIVTVTRIDLNQPNNVSSVCLNTQVSGLYATSKSVYLYGTNYQHEAGEHTEKSIIHKFSIVEQDIRYIASGVLDGRFNGQLSNLRFSEKGDDLRVVTTQGNRETGYEHHLNILSPSGNELSLVAQLPNDIYPEKIGKVNNNGIVQENIKSVRFFDNKAYIVTFLNTDPLYVLDLTEHAELKITGALEIPGYSSYLQPISDNLLVGIGQNVDPNRVDSISNNDGSTPIIEGAKISLFDVSNMASPTEIHAIVYENGYTPVEFDYHALTYLPTSDHKHRFGLPIERWGVESIIIDNQNVDVWHIENFLALIEVTGSDSDAMLVAKGNIESITSDPLADNVHISGWYDRAVFHDNDIYYLHGIRIWKSFWQTPDQITGPF